ncbi:MAG: alpha/beta hydrolase [Sphingomonadales bacterium]|nr:alpha/beta hydrolase [Sphingomonadales bacterium]MBU3991190.1 dienelactone hydrolase family protein [Alphaproteobacteria bacterium]
MQDSTIAQYDVSIGPLALNGILSLPPQPAGIVIFAHGSGSGRLSPRNTHVATQLNRAGFATLLLDLLTPTEEADRSKVFDIPLLAERLGQASEWVANHEETRGLSVGYFGASTGGGAALLAAAERDGNVAAVVSRGGRPDLAGAALARVRVPTLLIVGSLDHPVIDLNAAALAQLHCEKLLEIVPGASHLFEEPGTLDEVVRVATAWFRKYLRKAA